MFAVPAAEPTVDFLGIGMQKGGTTWLYHQLSRHPQVAFPRGKEQYSFVIDTRRSAGRLHGRAAHDRALGAAGSSLRCPTREWPQVFNL